MKPLDRVGGRKFVLCALVVLCVAALVAMGRTLDIPTASVLLGTAGAYITGNVSQKRLVQPIPENTVTGSPLPPLEN